MEKGERLLEEGVDQGKRKQHSPPPGHWGSWSRTWSSPPLLQPISGVCNMNGQRHRGGGCWTPRGEGSTLRFCIPLRLGEPPVSLIPSPS